MSTAHKISGFKVHKTYLVARLKLARVAGGWLIFYCVVLRALISTVSSWMAKTMLLKRIFAEPSKIRKNLV